MIVVNRPKAPIADPCGKQTDPGGSMIGKQGRVTGRLAPGLVGEVMIQVRGGAGQTSSVF